METGSPQPPPLAIAYKDRKAGLVIFGIFTILFGAFLLLSVPMAFIATAMAKNDPNMPATMANPLPGAIMNALLAAALIWVGIGSIMTRRWARAILVIASWSALLAGLTAAIFVTMMHGRLMEMFRAARPPNQPELPPQAEAIFVGTMVVMIALFYILLPLVWALFYGSKNVKATCEARDPKVRWTDRCPLPVLAVVLWTAFGALTMLGLTMWHPFLPVFGRLVTGPIAAIGYLIIAIIWGYAAWQLYRCDMRGWWIILAAMLLHAISSVLTYPRYSLDEIYRLLHYSPEQISMMTKVMPPNMLTWSAAFVVPLVAYLLYVRRFLSARS